MGTESFFKTGRSASLPKAWHIPDAAACAARGLRVMEMDAVWDRYEPSSLKLARTTTGIDLTDAAIEMARSDLRGRLARRVSGADARPGLRRSSIWVIPTVSASHANTRARAGIHRVLKPGGRAIVRRIIAQ